MRISRLHVSLIYVASTLVLMWGGGLIPSSTSEMWMDLGVYGSVAVASLIADFLSIRLSSLPVRGALRGIGVWVIALLVFVAVLTVAGMVHAVLKLGPSWGILVLPGLLLFPLSAPFILLAIASAARTYIILALFIFLGALLERYRPSERGASR